MRRNERREVSLQGSNGEEGMGDLLQIKFLLERINFKFTASLPLWKETIGCLPAGSRHRCAESREKLHDSEQPTRNKGPLKGAGPDAEIQLMREA
jgi:hypothetical protein